MRTRLAFASPTSPGRFARDRQIYNTNPAIRLAFKSRRISPEQFAPPPIARFAFCFLVRKPILVNDGANRNRLRPSCKRIAGKQVQYIGIVLKEPFLRPQHEAIFAPAAQRREPQIPIEAWLRRRVNSRRLLQILRLLTERVWNPSFF